MVTLLLLTYRRRLSQVKEPMMGRIRFQFWRDAIADIFEKGTSPENPVSTELLRAAQKHGVSFHPQPLTILNHTNITKPLTRRIVKLLTIPVDAAH